MTIDRSLRVRAGSIKNRNVLTRAERLQKLKESERWSEDKSVYGLPKVRVIKLALKKKKKAKAEEGAEGAAEGAAAAPAAGAATAKPAAGAKSAAGGKK
jgi:small basic protein (TIGR04137 family)